MTNKPVTSENQLKLVLFSLVVLSLIALIGIGVIPAIFLVFSIVMMKKNNDFSYITEVYKGCLIYSVIVFGFLSVLSVLTVSNDKILELLVFLFSAFLIFVLSLRFLFLLPLEAHSEWVVVNDIFSNRKKNEKLEINNDSVTDELIRLSKLKDDGHISEDEFNKIKSKVTSQ